MINVIRLQKEHKNLLKAEAKRKSQGITTHELKLFPTDPKNIYRWTAYIRGPPDSPYEGGVFELKLDIPRTYPQQPPKAHFVTKVCHPNVKWTDGEICLDVLKDQWTPVWTLESVTRAVIVLLGIPEASSPLNCDCGNLIRAGDMRGYWSLARMYTIDHALTEMPE